VCADAVAAWKAQVGAQADEERRRRRGDGGGPDHAAPSGWPGAGWQRRVQGGVEDVPGQGAHARIGTDESRLPTGDRQIGPEGERSRRPAESVTNPNRGRPQVDGEAAVGGPGDDGAYLGERGAHESGDIVGSSEAPAGGVHGLLDPVGADGELCEAGPARLLLSRGAAPLGLEGPGLGVEAQVERELLGLLAAQDNTLDEGGEDLVAAGRDRNAHAEVSADRVVLAEQDIEDDAVDTVVRAVEHEGADDLAGLAEAVHPALPLLVAGGVPGEVVVHHGLEVALQVDALGEAVGGDQHLAALSRPLGEVRDPCRALLRREFPGDDLHLDVPAQRGAQVLSDVVRRGDEPAEHDRVEVVPQEITYLGGEEGELGICRRCGCQVQGAAPEVAEGAASTAGGVLGVRVRAGRCVRTVEGVVLDEVQNLRGSDRVRTLLRCCGRRGCPCLECGCCRGRRRCHRTQQTEGGPPADPLLQPCAGPVLHLPANVGEDVVEEGAVLGREGVGAFLGLPVLGELSVLAEVGANVPSSPLNHVVREEAAAAFLGEIDFLQAGVEEADEVPEGRVVPAVRCRRHEDEVTVAIRSEVPREPEPLGTTRAGATGVVRGHSVGLVDDDEVRGGAEEVVPPRLRLHVVHRDHGDGVALEDRFVGGESALQAGDRAGEDEGGVESELLGEFRAPLLGKARRAEHREAACAALGEHLRCHESSLDGLADADVVGDQQPDGLVP